MDNERHAIEAAAPPAGYALAFNGEHIKKSCKTCGYLSEDGEYSNVFLICNHNDGDNPMQNLPGFPFKNGCKHFNLHFGYTVDWEAEDRRMSAEYAICQHLSHGKCYSYGWEECEHSTPIDKYTRECKRAAEVSA